MHLRLLLLAVAPAVAAAQDSTRATARAFFRKGDLGWTAGAVAATAALSTYDERIARWTRQSRVQGDSSRYHLVKHATVVNEVPLTIAAVSTWAVGRLTHSPAIADVGLHLTESLVITEVTSEAIRIALGRARPRASPADAYFFKPGQGLKQFEFRSFPSLHAAVAFATAATLSEEVRLRNPTASRYATPLLYAAATIPGFTRMYLDQHWASDVLAGSFVGALLGARLVQYAHGHATRFDRFLLGTRVTPNAYGGVSIGWTTRR